MSLFVKSLSATTSTGLGAAIYADSPKTTASLQVSYTGNPDVVTVVVEATLDGVHWKPFGGGNADTDGELYGFEIPPFIGLRANLTVLSGGTSPTVTAWIAAA